MSLDRVITHPTMVLVPGIVAYELIDPQDHLTIPPPPMVVQDLLAAGAVTGLTSPPGVGKTWFALELMRAVSQGTRALGEFDCDEGGVLFIGSDSSIFDYVRQWKRLTRADRQAWADSILVDRGPRPFGNVRWMIQSDFALDRAETVARAIKTHQQFQWATEPVWLKFDEWDEEEQRFVESHEPVWPSGFKLIVMDTFSRVYMGNQNDAAETDRAMGHARLIAEATGAAVLLLHHNAKKSEFNDGETWRGSSAMQGSLDAWLNLTQSKFDKHSIRGSWKKFRGITPADFDYRMLVMDPKDAKLVYTDAVGSSGPIEEDPLSVALIALLAQNPKGLTVAAIRAALWPQFSDVWKDEKSFKKALNNRTYGDLPVTAKLERITAPPGQPFTYRLKETDDAMQ